MFLVETPFFILAFFSKGLLGGYLFEIKNTILKQKLVYSRIKCKLDFIYV